MEGGLDGSETHLSTICGRPFLPTSMLMMMTTVTDWHEARTTLTDLWHFIFGIALFSWSTCARLIRYDTTRDGPPMVSIIA